MNKRSPASKALADPTQLSTLNKTEELLQVIIETPKNSRNKYSFDDEQKIFCLKKVLPAGMAFPYDFGFLPNTKASDGDPVDVLVLMDEPAFPGCLLQARLIGVIEGEQQEDGKLIRNDRLVAVAEANHSYTNIKQLKDLPSQFVKELEGFFVNYNKLQGITYKLLGCKGPAAARTLIDQARRAA